MNESNQRSSAGWDACPDGMLSQAVLGFNRNRRKQEVVRTAVAAIGFVTLVVIVGLVARQFLPVAGPNFGNITCTDTQSLMQQYAAGTLDAETSANVDEHLARCDGCRLMFEKMMATAGKTAARSFPGDRFAVSGATGRDVVLLAVRD
ncbi:MAG: zf-HC2 domain-containing protein [Pirellulales bacterium]|nr:zf-HC2 domain-containing protein [Pirellulales bacterium]